MSRELHDLAAPYALGALSAAERESFERHLSSCPQCRRDVEELGRGVEAIFESLSEEPPSGLKERLMTDLERPATSASTPRASTPLARWTLGAVAAALALIAGFALLTPPSEAERAEAILASADAVEVALDGVEGRVVRDDDQAVFVASDLAAVDEDRTYQLWYIGEAGPVSAGTFRPDDDGDAIVLLEGTAAEGLVVGLTEEPAGGSEQPTGEVLASAEL